MNIYLPGDKLMSCPSGGISDDRRLRRTYSSAGGDAIGEANGDKKDVVDDLAIDSGSLESSSSIFGLVFVAFRLR
jgi:hypothetical protein